VDHAVAIGYNDRETNNDGTQVNFRLREWPICFTRWNNALGQLEARTIDGAWIPIRHGDGTWTVFKKFDVLPWTQDACLLPAALIWAAHAEGLGDWAGATRAHGLAKIVGMLQEGTPLTQGSGDLTPEAQAFLSLIVALANGDSPAGIAPPGSKVDFLANGSTAWQVFAELISNRERAAARVYQGTDATLGAQGGAPGVDIAALFGVASTKLQGDLECIEQGLRTGVYEPWTAINDGDSRYAPFLQYQIPDPDADAKREQVSANLYRLINAVKGMRDQKLVVDQPVVDALAQAFGVSPVPQLADVTMQQSTIVLAPTDVAKVVRVSEARASQGLAPFGDARDNMTLTELDAYLQAKAAAALTPPAAPTAP
jgi:hypothetical protein